MNTNDWRSVMVSFIDGVIACLPRTANGDVHAELNAFREQAIGARHAKAKERFERELESYLQSSAQLRTAARKSLKPKVKAAVGAAVQALARAEYVLRHSKNA